jgi:hypothetical protein
VFGDGFFEEDDDLAEEGGKIFIVGYIDHKFVAVGLFGIGSCPEGVIDGGGYGGGIQGGLGIGVDKERYGKLDKPGEFGAEGFEVNIEIFFGKHGKVKIGG